MNQSIFDVGLIPLIHSQDAYDDTDLSTHIPHLPLLELTYTSRTSFSDSSFP